MSPRPAYVLFARHHGFGTPTGWRKLPTRCVVFRQLAAARTAARNLAHWQRAAVEIINCHRPRRGFNVRQVQSLSCLAHRRELTAEIAKYERAGVLVTTAKHHRFGY